MTSAYRKVIFPLKLKLLLVMIVLIATSLTVFVAIALKTFREDKTAYLFESLTYKAETLHLTAKQSSPTPEELKKILPAKTQYDYFFLLPSSAGMKLVSKEDRTADPEETKLFTKIQDENLQQGATTITIGDEPWLYSWEFDRKLNFASVVRIPQAEAFQVTRYIVNKSLTYGLFILGIAMILSVLLARPLTAQLEKLFGATQEIAKGNFSVRTEVQGADEVGALADSVNDMAGKIEVYIQEMREKARLENEVAVAQLVQSSFFPHGGIEEKKLEIKGHFEPATECGGDWWGVAGSDDWRVLFIADATGHGVPAALLTATINCCKTSLDYIRELKPDFLSRPDEILRFMNQAVSGAGKEIQVTCFVASLNVKTGKLVYANASHTPPLYFSGLKENLSKDDFQPLIEANGPRLGQNPDSRYESRTLELAAHDTIFFYTDGLTEGENAEGAQWGVRRLIKALAQHGRGSVDNVLGGVLSEFKAFSPERPKDDLTAVLLKVRA
ncbi:MAG: PP2C family protein-serine/threonine phosphatase [Bacteriovoracaceae bacterium]